MTGLVSRWWVACVAVLSIAKSAAAEPTPGRLLPAPVQYWLKNGLEVVLQENHHSPRVAVRMVYEVGHRHAPSGYAPLAHLVEHLTYRGSRHLHDGQALELLERFGLQAYQGTTTDDYTDYYEMLPASGMALPLWVESERMAFTLEHFDDEHLNVERQVVARETELRRDGDELFERAIKGGVFGYRHAYTRWGGTEGDLAAIDLEDAQWFFQQHYRPENARLIVVGDFVAADVRSLVERYFGPIAGPPLGYVRAPAQCAPLFSAKRVTFHRKARSQKVRVLWPAPAPFTAARGAAEGLRYALRRTLDNELVAQGGKGLEARLRLYDQDCGSYFDLEVSAPKDAKIDEVETRVQDALSAAWAQNFDALLPEFKRRYRMALLSSLENPVTVSELHRDALRRTGRPHDFDARWAAIHTLTAKDLLALRPQSLHEYQLVALLAYTDAEPLPGAEPSAQEFEIEMRDGRRGP